MPAKISHEEFEEKLKLRFSGSVSALTKYHRMTKRLRFVCNVCGNKWRATPNSLFKQSHGCPICSKGTGLSGAAAAFEGDLRLKWKNQLSLTGPFNGIERNVKVVCMECGGNRLAIAQNLLYGEACACMDLAKAKHPTPFVPSKGLRILGFDPGTDNFGYFIGDFIGSPALSTIRILENGLIKDTVRSMNNGDMAAHMMKFEHRIERLIRKYKPNVIVLERFQNRGRVKGLSPEAVPMMIAVIVRLAIKHRIYVKAIMAASWKNQFSREAGKKVDAFYPNIIPHLLDSFLIALYAHPAEGKYAWVAPRIASASAFNKQESK